MFRRADPSPQRRSENFREHVVSFASEMQIVICMCGKLGFVVLIPQQAYCKNIPLKMFFFPFFPPQPVCVERDRLS